MKDWLKLADLLVTKVDGQKMELEEIIVLTVQLGECKVTLQ